MKRPQLEQESLPQLPELIPIQKAKQNRKEVAYVKVTGVQGTSYLKVTEVPEVVSVDNDCEVNNEEVIQSEIQHTQRWKNCSQQSVEHSSLKSQIPVGIPSLPTKDSIQCISHMPEGPREYRKFLQEQFSKLMDTSSESGEEADFTNRCLRGITIVQDGNEPRVACPNSQTILRQLVESSPRIDRVWGSQPGGESLVMAENEDEVQVIDEDVLGEASVTTEALIKYAQQT